METQQKMNTQQQTVVLGAGITGNLLQKLETTKLFEPNKMQGILFWLDQKQSSGTFASQSSTK